ncbi:pyridoxamine 5'-phosphate oxidase family protein [Alkalibacter mobilis]|uniref:pyridoxamine 5'-phosphate oxidase family protein n=1 Tax=Alkalibacter mobilis TaxID=2787712 RepID=UPI00189F7760|nr:pyridoxamine 5'-phosphate oxidase family protein [Alkalibacter mobilis]MBF7095703.1 pyridoxamine 5'-phosphate oxidase family protein [Alkalibacter mobilis]
MRRKDREVFEISELLQIIDQCKICRIAMQDSDGLYIVPMNFGYQYKDDKLILFFHSAREGRKISALEKENHVCFEMDCEHALVKADTACQHSFSFKSCVGFGKASFIVDVEEKKTALSSLMKHQTGLNFMIDDKMLDGVSVFKIMVENFTGKFHG